MKIRPKARCYVALIIIVTGLLISYFAFHHGKSMGEDLNQAQVESE